MVSSIDIRVTTKAAGTLEEMLTTITYQTASRTGPRSIGRADNHHLHACLFGLLIKSLALPIVGQHSGFRSLTFQQMPLVIPQLKLYFLTSLSRGDRNSFGAWDEPDQVFIKIKTCWLEFFRRVLLTEGRGDTGN